MRKHRKGQRPAIYAQPQALLAYQASLDSASVFIVAASGWRGAVCRDRAHGLAGSDPEYSGGKLGVGSAHRSTAEARL